MCVVRGGNRGRRDGGGVGGGGEGMNSFAWKLNTDDVLLHICVYVCMYVRIYVCGVFVFMCVCMFN